VTRDGKSVLSWPRWKVLLVLVTLAAVVGLSLPAAGSPFEKQISASVVYISGAYGSGCYGAAVLQFPDVRGAVSYRVDYLDNGRPVSAVGPPFYPDDPMRAGNETTPAGTHRLGLSGGTSSDPTRCSDGSGLLQRFKVVRAVAIFNKKPGTCDLTTDFSTIPPGTVAKVIEIKGTTAGSAGHAYIRKGGTGPLMPLTESENVQIGDVISTNAGSVMAMEFAIGGIVGLNAGAEVTIVNERGVKATHPGLKIFRGGMWAKCGKLKEPLEIQTNGGAMGIKG
jgi:hypothetical protein